MGITIFHVRASAKNDCRLRKAAYIYIYTRDSRRDTLSYPAEKSFRAGENVCGLPADNCRCKVRREVPYTRHVKKFYVPGIRGIAGGFFSARRIAQSVGQCVCFV